ncbi:GNAT family N-acetyltransferase [Nocardioides sp. Root151]|uniref:GNAT family N-acetyltransferase n=1 Tax=Nocardioides sp. Root151 TaxID=1736475 RepID=UPI0007034E97|nr:GNAT family N-acetyltransferase [Nocardioides sp. Root151]KQZ76076.1 GCN5 family acetyltransferase [Nocardioides sp. Root151]
MPLLAGLTTRPLALDDAAAVTALMAAEELADIGEVAIEEADIVSDWQRPSFDLAASTIGVLDGDRLIGYGERSLGSRADAAVDPAYHGRGIGTFIAEWLEEHARRAGAPLLGMPVPQGSPGDRLLEARGYRVRWTSWGLELPPGKAIEPRPLPEGFTLREARADEARCVWTVVEDAFLEWSVRERDPFEDFAAKVMERPGFQPWNLRVVADEADAVVGVSFVIDGEYGAFIEKLAVRKDLRGRGLAQALLSDSFTVAREHGATRSELSTDSRTGALGLYEKVGMEVTSTWVNRALDL